MLVVTALILAGCAPTPPVRVSLPDLESALPPPVECTFLIGSPLGVLVEEVIPDSAAAGILEVGDVIVAADGTDTPDSAALLVVLGSKTPGDLIEIDYVRDGSEQTSTISLGANPDEPARPMIGIMIRTEYESVPARETEGSIDPGPTVRPISIGSDLYLLDPGTPDWERTALTPPDDLLWASTGSDIYVVDEGMIRSIAEEAEVPHDGLEGWDPARAIGSIGDDLLLVVTRPVADNPEEVTLAVARLDPSSGTTSWVIPLLAGTGIPVSALNSPDRTHFLLIGVNEDGTEITSAWVWDQDGEDLGLEDLQDFGTPIGWMDDSTLLFRSEGGTGNLVAVPSGEPEQVSLDPQLATLPLFAVGDGHSVLAVDGQNLVIDDIDTDTEVRTLAADCVFGRVGEPGWSA